MVDVPNGAGIAGFEDPIKIESPLKNAFLDGCKEGLLALQMMEVRTIRTKFICLIR